MRNREQFPLVIRQSSVPMNINLTIKIRHALNPQLVEQLAEIRAILPWLVTNVSKLGYRPGRADGPDKHLVGPQEISFGEQKAPPDFDSSEPPSQDIKDRQNESHPRDKVLSAKSNPDSEKDVPLTPNVQESLPPQAVSEEPVLDVIQEPSHERANYATSETLSHVAFLTRNQSPAASSNWFDSAKYEAWLLTYRKAHVKRETKYKETVLITRPFKQTITWGEVIPTSYHFSKIQLPESELESAVLEKEATPVIEVIASLPLATQEAVDDLLERRYARRPSLARVNIVKRSAWGRFIGRRKILPSLIVFLECQPDEILRRPVNCDRTYYVPPRPNVPDPPSFQRRRTRVRQSGRVRGRPTRLIATRERSFERRRPYSNRTYSEVEEDAIEKCRGALASSQQSRFENTINPCNYRDTLWLTPVYSRSASEASKASGKQALPSEQEAERIMEEFLSKLTTSQDNEDLTRQDDAIAATVTADSKEAEQKIQG